VTPPRDPRAQDAASEGAPPDNVAAWDELAEAYQRYVGWPDDELAWGLACPSEAELRLVSDVAEAARTVVLGCGGGQDLIALAELGAGPLVGVDPSTRQLDHARQRLEAKGLEADLIPTTADDLRAVGDGWADLVVSVQALNYLSDPVACFAEVARILRPGGHLAFSVLHPADVSTDDHAPFGWHTSWFEIERDWVWDGLAEQDVELRSWFRSASEWFTAVSAAGLVVERLLEPPAASAQPWIERGWLEADADAKLAMVPATILLRARRPGVPTGDGGVVASRT
jgi:SAM-dependent methyltransferase